jgi:hypothetical protein
MTFLESARIGEKKASAQYANRLSHHGARYFLEKTLSEHGFKGRVIEVGAGSCWASTLIKRESPSTTVIASDISIEDLRIGMKTARDLGSSADLFVACDARWNSVPYIYIKWIAQFPSGELKKGKAYYLNDRRVSLLFCTRYLKE